MIQNSLVVQDLGGRNGSGAAILYRIAEGADLLIEVRGCTGLGNDLGDLGLNLLARNLVVDGQVAADGAVPALGGGDTKAALGTVDDGITGGVKPPAVNSSIAFLICNFSLPFTPSKTILSLDA